MGWVHLGPKGPGLLPRVGEIAPVMAVCKGDVTHPYGDVPADNRAEPRRRRWGA